MLKIVTYLPPGIFIFLKNLVFFGIVDFFFAEPIDDSVLVIVVVLVELALLFVFVCVPFSLPLLELSLDASSAELMSDLLAAISSFFTPTADSVSVVVSEEDPDFPLLSDPAPEFEPAAEPDELPP